MRLLTEEQKEMNRFSDFVRGELRRQGKQQRDLAGYLYLTPQAISLKLKDNNWSGKDIIQTLQFLGKSYEFGKEVHRR